MATGIEMMGRLERLRWWQRLLDEAFRVPGTRIRFGCDAVIGLIPWAGDLLSAGFGLVILFHAHRMRLPAVVLVRMVMNLAIDLTIGLVPFAGDVADIFWKANTRNLALVERHAVAALEPTRGDWWFVLGVAAALFALAAIPLFLLLGLGRALGIW